MAVNEDGKREVLGVATGPSEAETFWTDFLRSLADRGLRGVKLVIADDHKGPARCRAPRVQRDPPAVPHSLDEERPGARSGQAAHGGRGDAEDDLRAGNQGRGRDSVGDRGDALREKQPKLGALMDASRDDVLAYMTFPRVHWTQIASTNPLERVNREVKRRSDVIGIFPNDEAIIRLVGALMLETNDQWAVARRYMSLETLARVTENPNVRLPAVAA